MADGKGRERGRKDMPPRGAAGFETVWLFQDTEVLCPVLKGRHPHTPVSGLDG